MVRKGKEFILPANVQKEYGIVKGYSWKDFLYVGLPTLVVDLLIILIPPYSIGFMMAKVFFVFALSSAIIALITVRPVPSRPNIRIWDYWKTRSYYNKMQKLYFLKPKKGDY